MLKPIAPFVEYAINYDYISKIRCINKAKPELNCQGKCQLMKKLEQQEEEDYQSLRINLKDYPIGFIKLLEIPSKKDDLNPLKANHFYKNQYAFIFSFNVFHPPIV